ncbi:hypothetical protein AVEN_185359-1 [Araneus ventricosus]|uniref:Uncharacterized protein n=1 Tax=Araneus ventricosus TaxID=182803 RepID=A0A4Y2HSC4_ARAVE|nr:hypothetical protein AVEN_185359-1 [Araneus ventricosus]
MYAGGGIGLNLSRAPRFLPCEPWHDFSLSPYTPDVSTIKGGRNLLAGEANMFYKCGGSFMVFREVQLLDSHPGTPLLCSNARFLDQDGLNSTRSFEKIKEK